METVFYQRMKFLCAQKDIEISNVLKAVGLSTSKGTAWKDGAIPKGDVLLVLANYFNVSTDYLLGNTDDPTPAGQKESRAVEGKSAATQPEWYGKLTPENLAKLESYAAFLLTEQQKDQP